MTDFAEALPRPGRLAAIGRLSTNACIATLVAGAITLGQWAVIDRPQADRLSRQGEAAMIQADVHSLSDTVRGEIDGLMDVVAAQIRSGKLLPETRAALNKAQTLQDEAEHQAFDAHDYEAASATLLEIHEIVEEALCLVQHFPLACRAVDHELEGLSSKHS
jgi:hypothetical protein